MGKGVWSIFSIIFIVFTVFIVGMIFDTSSDSVNTNIAGQAGIGIAVSGKFGGGSGINNVKVSFWNPDSPFTIEQSRELVEALSSGKKSGSSGDESNTSTGETNSSEKSEVHDGDCPKGMLC